MGTVLTTGESCTTDLTKTFPTDFFLFSLVSDMEIIPEGKNFRLVQDEELPQILEMLEQHLPHSLKVSIRYTYRYTPQMNAGIYPCHNFHKKLFNVHL
jgi:hypothetical protein